MYFLAKKINDHKIIFFFVKFKFYYSTCKSCLKFHIIPGFLVMFVKTQGFTKFLKFQDLRLFWQP